MTNGNESITAHLTYDTYTGAPNGFIDGLTKREYFAARALQGLLSNNNVLKFFQRDGLSPNDFISLVSKDSTAIADSLIKALNETQQ